MVLCSRSPKKLGEKQSGASLVEMEVNLNNQLNVGSCKLYTHPKIAFI